MPSFDVVDQRETLISLIYEAALHPDGWNPFLAAIHQQLSADLSAIIFRNRPHGSLTLTVRRGEGEEEDMSSRTYADVGEGDALAFEDMESGRLYTVDELAGRRDIMSSPFFAEHLRMPETGHLALLAIGPRDGFRAHFLWLRDEAAGPLGQDERALLESLVPHLTRGMAIFARKILLQVATGICTVALEQIAFGAIAIDMECRILVSNRVAEDLIARSEDVSRVNDRLIFRRKDHARTMHELATNLDVARTEKVLRLRSGEDIIGLLARPVAPRAADDAVTTARVVLYLHALTGHSQPSPVLLSQLFGLAPSEAMLAILLSEGATLREAAKQLGITENTARTYSKRIFSKTGVRRQADLVRVILRSIAIFGHS